MHNFLLTRIPLTFLVGGLIERLQSYGMGALACTMHGSFKSSLDLGTTDVS